eukprot:CAMPEP_0177594634 /NCGR_PEP_ID=MMETSP0419_2-20121207/9889_1 /TAXON_ID=582737 /ORGANISM="Tetraselmis sp., Strain GSL018" /LENGTH=488 /DNA_ID=CAMNT_0019085963 /DNA_START=147 /DNA_END=1614 /DNA_ORIENTATION=-
MAETETDKGDNEIATTLYREAQDEIASLRSELYTTRRREWEVKEALTKAEHARDDALRDAEELRQRAAALQAATDRGDHLNAKLQELERQASSLGLEAAELRQRLGEAERELSAEQTARRRTEELRARAEGDRSRLQRERDEARSQLGIAQRRAAEAEEEQCRAEEDAAQARAELAAYAREGGGSQHGGSMSNLEEEQLRRELESQRDHAAALLKSLEKAKAEAAAAREQAAAASQEDGEGPQKELLDRREAELARREADVERRASELDRREAAVRGGDGQRKDPDWPAPVKGDDASEAEELRERVAGLEATISRLKHTREKLLLEMDEMSATVERLFTENTALSEALVQQREISSKWELQAQEGLLRAEQLKNMLEESAKWGNGEDGPEAEPRSDSERLESELIAERARCADLDLKVRALSAELTKASQHTGEIGRSVLPVLSSIESRILQVVLKRAAEVSRETQAFFSFASYGLCLRQNVDFQPLG